jgi:hypothetical protein
LPELLAVTVMVELPTGVLGGAPQAKNPEVAAKSVTNHMTRLVDDDRRLFCQTSTKPKRLPGNQHSSVGVVPESGGPFGLSRLTVPLFGPVVVMVMTVLSAEFDPLAVNVAGLKLHEASDGSPVQAKVSDPL